MNKNLIYDRNEIDVTHTFFILENPENELDKNETVFSLKMKMDL